MYFTTKALVILSDALKAIRCMISLPLIFLLSLLGRIGGDPTVSIPEGVHTKTTTFNKRTHTRKLQIIICMITQILRKVSHYHLSSCTY